MTVTSVWITQTEGSFIFIVPNVCVDYDLLTCGVSDEGSIVPGVTRTNISLTATAEVEAEIAADPKYPVVGE